jgi:hypothetical protein
VDLASHLLELGALAEGERPTQSEWKDTMPLPEKFSQLLLKLASS